MADVDLSGLSEQERDALEGKRTSMIKIYRIAREEPRPPKLSELAELTGYTPRTIQIATTDLDREIPWVTKRHSYEDLRCHVLEIEPPEEVTV